MPKYVGFVSDGHFLNCVKWVIDSYPNPSKEPDIKRMKRNTLDPFKMVFDCTIKGVDVKDWLKNEEIRQNDKTINNRIGDFHQLLLGNVAGWVDLGRGSPYGVDLKKEDDTVFIELKNKFNTVNSSSLSAIKNKLKKIARKHPAAKVYWAYIISKNGDSGELPLVPPMIYRIWGAKVYELVTGDPKALEKTWRALPIAINDLMKGRKQFSGEDAKLLQEFFVAAFHQI